MVTPRKFDETSEQYLTRLAQEAAVPPLSVDVSDVWRLEPSAGEQPDDYAVRAIALGCGPDYCRQIHRRALS